MKRIWMTDKWVEGISDGLTLSCSLCGNVPHFDYRVDDKFWNKIVHKSISLGVVCLSCLDKLATDVGLDVADHIEELQFTGIGKTVIFVPETTYYYMLNKWGKDSQHKELNDFTDKMLPDPRIGELIENSNKMAQILSDGEGKEDEICCVDYFHARDAVYKHAELKEQIEAEV